VSIDVGAPASGGSAWLASSTADQLEVRDASFIGCAVGVGHHPPRPQVKAATDRPDTDVVEGLSLDGRTNIDDAAGSSRDTRTDIDALAGRSIGARTYI
jgi:hypothetical protein